MVSKKQIVNHSQEKALHTKKSSNTMNGTPTIPANVLAAQQFSQGLEKRHRESVEQEKES